MSEFLTGVSADLVASHEDPLGLEGEHEHTWRVTAWWPAEPLRDGRALRASLTLLLGTLPKVLPQDLWSAEAIAKHVMVLVGCVGCDIDREGFHVRLRT